MVEVQLTEFMESQLLADENLDPETYWIMVEDLASRELELDGEIPDHAAITRWIEMTFK